MCALILFYQLVPDFPVVLAANRDETYDRPSKPPRVDRALIPFLAPVDQRAGGTWIGTSAAGLTVAVTNRRGEANDPSRPSRGALVRDALSNGSAAAARVHLQRGLSEGAPNAFNLLYVDARDAYFTRGGGGDVPVTTRLDPGVHVVTNLHELNELELIEVERIASVAGISSLVETVSALSDFLKNDEPVAADGFAPCKDHGDRGTRSSTIIARADSGTRTGMFLHADGNPRSTRYEDYSDLLRTLGPNGSAR